MTKKLTKEEVDQFREDFQIEFPAEEVARLRARKQQLEEGIAERQEELMKLTKDKLLYRFPRLPKSYTKPQMTFSIAYAEINKGAELETIKQQLSEFERKKKLLEEYDALIYCDDCGHQIKLEEAQALTTWTGEEKTVCEDCYHEYFECDECGNEVSVDEDGFEALPNGDHYCPKCYKEFKQKAKVLN